MIVRTVKNKDNPYYVKSRAAVSDDRLSWKAKGIHDYLMSKPDHWEANIEELAKASTDGRDSIRSGIKELIKHGYMNRIRETEKGKVTGWRLDTYEKPDVEKPDVEKPDVEKPDVEKPTLVINEYKKVMNIVSNDIADASREQSPSAHRSLVPKPRKKKERSEAAKALSLKNKELLLEYEPKGKPVWSAIEKQINTLAAGSQPMTPDEYEQVFRALKRDPFWASKPLTPVTVGKQAGAILNKGVKHKEPTVVMEGAW